MLKRTHLRYFIALAEAGGFTAAARRLNLSQPTLSSSLAELERRVGTPLFVRDRRTIRLTDAGHRLLAMARSIEREFRAAETTLLPGRASGQPHTLGVLASLPSAMIARFLARFDDTRPLTLVEGSDADLRRRLGARQIDAALTLRRDGETAGPELDEGYVVLMSSGHRLSGRRELEVEELACETMVARRSCELLGETSKFFTARGVRPRLLIRSSNEDRCLALVREGFAITTGPASLTGNGVIGVPLKAYTFRRRIGLIMPEGNSAKPLLAAWTAALSECSASPPP